MMHLSSIKERSLLFDKSNSINLCFHRISIQLRMRKKMKWIISSIISIVSERKTKKKLKSSKCIMELQQAVQQAFWYNENEEITYQTESYKPYLPICYIIIKATSQTLQKVKEMWNRYVFTTQPNWLINKFQLVFKVDIFGMNSKRINLYFAPTILYQLNNWPDTETVLWDKSHYITYK